MKKSFGSFIIAAALSGTIGANVQAEEVTVKKGDTLWDLAQIHKTTVENIIALNALKSETIYAGDTLQVSPQKKYEVQKGDTLWEIALAHAISLQDLMVWNELTGELIVPGMQLTIDGPASNPERTKPIKLVKVSAPAAPKTQKTNTVKKSSASALKTTGRELVVTATAYTASCSGCSGITATGINLKNNPGAKVISVDPSVIPLGTKVYVEGYGYAIAGDTGGAIKGNKIDVFVPSRDAALQWGRKTVKVTVLE